MNLSRLMPLVGCWSGPATVLPPGGAPIAMRHTEEVRARNAGTMRNVGELAGTGRRVFCAHLQRDDSAGNP